MILGTLKWNQEPIACTKTGICKVELVLRDRQVRLAGIIVYCSICCRTIPPTEHILKSQIKAAACKTILGYTSFLVAGRLPLMGRWATFDVCAIYGTKSTSKERVEFAAVPDLTGNRCGGRGQKDILGVEWCRGECKKDFLEIPSICQIISSI
jgi:hypothetical protein